MDLMIERLKSMRNRLADLDNLLMSNEVTGDKRKYRDLSKERANLEAPVEKFGEYEKIEKDLEEALLMKNDVDPELKELGASEYTRLSELKEKTLKEIEIMLLPKDENDDKNVVVEIRGAVGGDEANIFAGDLFRMYCKYFDRVNWKVQVTDETESEAGGFSNIQFMVKGKSVYSKLKFESGSHRVQRVPKTEASGRIHTSTATVLVMPEAEELDYDINPTDLKIDTYRSSGAGGQNVNKTESAVRITHIPSGIVVACQVERSQIQNREIAMNLLRARLKAKLDQEQEEKLGAERRLKVGTGERAEKIRTYNYPQNRLTDHRIGYTVQKLDRVMEGDLDELLEALYDANQKDLLEGK